MPAQSKAQHGAAGLALAAKKGDVDPKTLRGAAKQMFNSMSKKQLEEYASTSTKQLPKKVGRPTRTRNVRSA